ncbi:MAG: GMC family oxidoreductase [Pseudomonadota bacterium]
MLIDLEQYDGPDTLDADVCVVGAGVAGALLAERLAAAGVDVCLLEAGGADFEDRTQALYAGTNAGMDYYPLDGARLRFFGGTANIWGGRCVSLDRIDFERREWVPYSGWPITAEDLVPYYRRAHDHLELGEYDYSDDLWAQCDGGRPEFDADKFATRFWRFDEQRERFVAGRSPLLHADARARVVLHANVTRLAAAPNADRIERVEVSTLGGRKLSVCASQVVLAAGAVENARLLLVSNDVQPHGVGNDRDQVGRYFMEHPHARIGTLDPGSGADFKLWSAFRKRFLPVPIAPVLLASPALQRERELLNTAVTFKLQRPTDRGTPLNRRLYLSLKHQLNPTRTGRALWHGYRDAKKLLQRSVRNSFERTRAAVGATTLHLMVRAEQAPNPASRVRLDAHERDALGVPRVALDWQLGEQDKHTLNALNAALGAEFQRLGYGALRPSEWLADDSLAWPVDPTIGNHPIGGYHHMGTTRMSADPARGVVDADCRVHGYDNLSIAGSSVFATGGWANPTLTILALAERLADRLKTLV